MSEETAMVNIAWIDMGDGWRRASWVREGYDCHTECKHTPKGDHGISDDDWIYVVSNGEIALALCVDSGIYPPSVVRVDSDKPRAWDFEIHAPWPIDGDEGVEEMVRLGRKGRRCGLVETGFCYTQRTGMSAGEEWFKKHGTASFEQPQAFWDALRQEAAERFAAILKERDDDKHIVQCPCCRGKGVVDDRKGVAR